MEYRKKPVVIKAVQITDEWFDLPRGVTLLHDVRQVGVESCLAGRVYGNVGDWLIIDAGGEKSFCNPDIFEMTYEPIEL